LEVGSIFSQSWNIDSTSSRESFPSAISRNTLMISVSEAFRNTPFISRKTPATAAAIRLFPSRKA
jgi:hypothetical protein